MRVFKWLLFLLLIPALLVAAYIFFVLNWSFSEGERAGWVQKLSKKGWLCKTWEGELSLISTPGAGQEKFLFTVHSDEVAAQINRAMGKRVALHYEEKVGIPTSCFGDTRYFVTKITAVDEIQLAPGVVVPVPQQQPAPPPAAAPQPAPASPTAAPAASAPAAAQPTAK